MWKTPPHSDTLWKTPNTLPAWRYTPHLAFERTELQHALEEELGQPIEPTRHLEFTRLLLQTAGISSHFRSLSGIVCPCIPATNLQSDQHNLRKRYAVLSSLVAPTDHFSTTGYAVDTNTSDDGADTI